MTTGPRPRTTISSLLFVAAVFAVLVGGFVSLSGNPEGPSGVSQDDTSNEEAIVPDIVRDDSGVQRLVYLGAGERWTITIEDSTIDPARLSEDPSAASVQVIHVEGRIRDGEGLLVTPQLSVYADASTGQTIAIETVCGRARVNQSAKVVECGPDIRTVTFLWRGAPTLFGAFEVLRNATASEARTVGPAGMGWSFTMDPDANVRLPDYLAGRNVDAYRMDLTGRQTDLPELPTFFGENATVFFIEGVPVYIRTDEGDTLQLDERNSTISQAFPWRLENRSAARWAPGLCESCETATGPTFDRAEPMRMTYQEGLAWALNNSPEFRLRYQDDATWRASYRQIEDCGSYREDLAERYCMTEYSLWEMTLQRESDYNDTWWFRFVRNDQRPSRLSDTAFTQDRVAKEEPQGEGTGAVYPTRNPTEMSLLKNIDIERTLKARFDSDGLGRPIQAWSFNMAPQGRAPFSDRETTDVPRYSYGWQSPGITKENGSIFFFAFVDARDGTILAVEGSPAEINAVLGSPFLR